ncbi:Permeases of the major facilitator superfamily [Hyphomicrobium sulfonivorans]|uniref:Permeases of the major facilitator superfamily n=2 Tax=Hyphomicrobium sulfonivorans TaxID=121290 RepID=A0A109BKJ7_HYPSL|nr:Permeases of the major facilitator superfamily [Hyphomicrobium sulfonivorans]
MADAQKATAEPDSGISGEERRVIFASSLGTVFEWYDFYLYATLAPFFAALFFPPGNDTAALLSAFATYAAGFLVRPFGAIVFGHLGDIVGRKHTFLITILVMGISTFAVGLLPTFSDSTILGYEIPGIGWAAPVLLVILRLLQGLALGGEYGGAATYVAEHARPHRRGFATSWIQTTATLGFFLALVVIGLCRFYFFDAETFAEWGWRVAFLVSIALLGFSVYIRLKLNESPVFARMKAEGKGSKSPIRDSFFRYPNNKFALLALLGATAGQGVVWYTGQFYALFFLTITTKVDPLYAYMLIAGSLIIGTPFFIFFGWLSDRIGRVKIILAGCLIAALTYFPLFGLLAKSANPDLAAFQQRTNITLSVDPAQCNFHIFVGPWSQFTECDRAKDHISKLGVSFETRDGGAGAPVVLNINGTDVTPYTADTYNAALVAAGYPNLKAEQVEGRTVFTPIPADPDKIAWGTVLAILSLFLIYVAMVYGPIAAFLVELFPTQIRYTSMSLPYHIGNGWFGGMLPLLATAIVAWSGNIYAGLWYPVIVALVTFVIGLLFLPETKDRDLDDVSGSRTDATG